MGVAIITFQPVDYLRVGSLMIVLFTFEITRVFTQLAMAEYATHQAARQAAVDDHVTQLAHSVESGDPLSLDLAMSHLTADIICRTVFSTSLDSQVALDVFEDEPAMKPGLAELDNVVVVPHIASATVWTREGMSSLAAANVAALLQGYPVWQGDDISPFLQGDVPQAAPSIVNAADLGL